MKTYMTLMALTTATLLTLTAAVVMPASSTSIITDTDTDTTDRHPLLLPHSSGPGGFDVAAALMGGAATGATGDNAVAAVADEDSGAVGVVGDDTAMGAAAPGAAIGFGFNNILGANGNPAATPAVGNIFNLFN